MNNILRIKNVQYVTCVKILKITMQQQLKQQHKLSRWQYRTKQNLTITLGQLLNM